MSALAGKVALVAGGSRATGAAITRRPAADVARAGDQRKLLAVSDYGSPDDIASMVGYLAGPEGRFVTGTELRIDGGFAA